jgi:integrase
MLFAAAAEAASNGEEQTQTSPENGGEPDQIQFLLGHVSIQTTERYLGCKQRFHDAVNDHIGLEPDAPS